MYLISRKDEHGNTVENFWFCNYACARAYCESVGNILDGEAGESEHWSWGNWPNTPESDSDILCEHCQQLLAAGLVAAE